MGLFISYCPNCGKEIHWFLYTPKNFICSCGQSVTPEEIEKSWEETYRNEQQSRGTSD